MMQLRHHRFRRLRRWNYALALSALAVVAFAQATNHYQAVQDAATRYRAGDAVGAVSGLREYLAQSPDDLGARVELARYLAFSKRYPEAMEQYNDVLRRDPQNIPATLGIAKIHSWEGDFPAALDLYDKILVRSPQFYDARVGKGFTLLWMGEKEQAAEIFRWAARVHPQDSELKQAFSELGISSNIAAARPAASAPTAITTSPHRKPERMSDHRPSMPPAQVSSFPEPVAPAAALKPDRFPPAATALVVSIAFVMCGALVFLWRNHASTGSSTLPAPGPQAQLGTVRRPKVLIGDTNVSALEFQRTVFTGAGFDAVCATSTEESLRALRQHRFDHIVIDAEMHEAVTFIRQHLPTLAQRMLLTAATPEHANRLKQSTGLRCVARPLRMSELIASAHPRNAPPSATPEYASH
jgi:tetratricopeptide (TPR) repeat protein